MASCIRTCTAANSSFLLVKWVPKYVNSLTTSTCYSARLILCATCLLFLLGLETLYVTHLFVLKPAFFPSLFRSLKASFFLLRIYPSGLCRLRTQPFALIYTCNVPLVSIHSCLMTCSNARLKRSGASPSSCFRPCVTSEKCKNSVCVLTCASMCFIVNSTFLNKFFWDSEFPHDISSHSPIN